MPSNPERPPIETLLERYALAFATKDSEAVAALHSTSGSFWLHHDEAPVHGRPAIADRLDAIFGLWPHIDFVVQRKLLGDDFWVLDWTIALTRDTPAGSGAQVDCLDLVTVDSDGLVLRKDTFVDGPQLRLALAASSGAGVAEAGS
jgi:hypothetical protein